MNKRSALALSLMLSVAQPQAVQAQAAPSAEAIALAAKFGARESIQAISMSPDGEKLALVEPEGDGQKILIADLQAGGEPRSILTSTRATERILGCRWPTVTRLFCYLEIYSDVSGILVGFGRMIAVDVDGHNLAVVTPKQSMESLSWDWSGGGVIDWNGTRPGQVLMTREFVPENSTGSMVRQLQEGFGVESVDVATLRRTIVETPQLNIDEYITDGQGHVRIKGVRKATNTGYVSGVESYFYRKADDRNWKLLSTYDESDGIHATGFDPYAVDPALDVVYGFEAGADGRRALYSIKLDGSDTKTLVLGRHDVDVDNVITIGRQRHVVGATYATDRRQFEFFDPALARLGSALTKALPVTPQIEFIDASSDENRLLLVAESDTDAGKFYRLDRTSHKLELILPARPELEGVTLSPMVPITFPARDGTMIPGYLTLPPTGPRTGLPAIVMPHGGPSARDEWGFSWLVQYFAVRGFAVLQPNFRGSSGYGSAWFNKNGFQSWPAAISDVDDAGRWLVAQKIADPAHLAIFGWSYGGYAALQSGVTEPGLYKAIVAVAPVTDLERLRAQVMKYGGGVINDRMIGHGDHVNAGSPALHAGNISVPVLLFHGDRDINVNIEESREMANRLHQANKQVDLVEFKGLDHQLDSTAARTTMLSRSDAFLRSALGL